MPTFFNNFPVGNRKPTKYHESSWMRSPRDGDATGRQYLRNITDSAQIQSIGNGLNYVRRELGKLRRRQPGGGSGGTTTQRFKGEWSPTQSYLIDQEVAFTPSGGAAGMYVAIKAVPAGIYPDTGSPYWFGFPNSPPGVWA